MPDTGHSPVTGRTSQADPFRSFAPDFCTGDNLLTIHGHGQRRSIRCEIGPRIDLLRGLDEPPSEILIRISFA